jgi:sugar transferase (PEP-CTERM system associated)
MPTLFNRYYPVRNLCFFFGEGILIFLSVMLVNWLFKGSGVFDAELYVCVLQSLLVTLIFQACLYFFDLYDLSKEISLSDTVTGVILAFGIGCIVLGFIYYLLPGLIIPSRVFLAGFLVIFLAVIALRSLYFYILRKKMFTQVIVIIGTGKLASDISREIGGSYDSIYKIRGFVGGEEPECNPSKAPVYAELEEISDVLASKKIDRIIIAPDDRRGTIPVHALIRCKMQGIVVEPGVNFYERVAGKILVERVNPSWIFFSDGFALSRFKRVIKRITDILSACILLVPSFPLLILSAIIIKLESSGPIFYQQERVGQNGTTFKLIKLRSMCTDAEKDGAVWASVNDSRVTRFGAIMRKTRIDELPQLWNILKGEMSMVGPRPERPVFVEKLVQVIPYYDIRHTAKPGVTGWAQVCYPYGASTEDALRKLEYDLYYLKNISIALDMFIIFKTIKIILFQRGAR